MLNELLLRDPCMFRSSASSDKLDCESNDENFGERFIFESAVWLWMTLTDWNWGILGRAPVEFKELVVADFAGDDEDVGPLLVEFGSFPLTMFVLLWLWLMVLLLEGVSRLRKCLNEKGFSFGGSVGCLKSFRHEKKKWRMRWNNCTIYFSSCYLNSHCQRLLRWNSRYQRRPSDRSRWSRLGFCSR